MNGKTLLNPVSEIGRPDHISGTLQHWASEWGIQIEYIQPGKP
jgi:hypothetical protein